MGSTAKDHEAHRGHHALHPRLCQLQEQVEIPTSELDQLLKDVEKASSFVMDGPCHGVRGGVGLRKVTTPPNSKGTLTSWPRKTSRLTIMENTQGKTMVTKKMNTLEREDVCMAYFYQYNGNKTEELTDTTRRPPPCLMHYQPTHLNLCNSLTHHNQWHHQRREATRTRDTHGLFRPRAEEVEDRVLRPRRSYAGSIPHYASSPEPDPDSCRRGHLK